MIAVNQMLHTPLLKVHNAMKMAGIWPHGVAGAVEGMNWTAGQQNIRDAQGVRGGVSPFGSPPRELQELHIVEYLLESQGLITTSCTLAQGMIGVLVRPGGLIVLNDRFAGDLLARRSRDMHNAVYTPLRRWWRSMALVMLAAHLVFPSEERVITLSMDWQDDAYTPLWKMCWWLALEMELPAISLVRSAPTTNPLPAPDDQHDQHDQHDQEKPRGPLDTSGPYRRSAPPTPHFPLPDTLSARIVAEKRELIERVMRASPFASHDVLHADHPIWTSQAIATALASQHLVDAIHDVCADASAICSPIRSTTALYAG